MSGDKTRRTAPFFYALLSRIALFRLLNSAVFRSKYWVNGIEIFTNESTMNMCAKAGRPRKDDMDRRIDALLELAGKLFLERGYSKTSLAAVAQEGRVALRTIYVKFGGKAGLFKAVIERRGSHYGSVDIGSDDRRPVRIILEDFSNGLLQLTSSTQVIRMHRMIIAEACSHPEVASTFYQASRGHTLNMLRSFFSRKRIAEHFKHDITPEQLALHLMNCVCGDQVSRFFADSESSPDSQQRRKELMRDLDFFFKSVGR